MKQRTNPALIKALKDDPWFQTIDPRTLDTSGFGIEFRPLIEEDNNFDVPLVNERAQSKSGMLHSALLSDPEILKELASKEFRTPQEDEVLKQYDRNPSFTFHTNGFQVTARWDKNTWACVAVSEEDDSRQLFKLGGHTRFDKDAVMSHANKYLVPKKPWNEITAEQLTVVSRIASGGNLRAMEEAVWTYLNYALPGIDRDVSSEKAYQPLCDSICWFVFRHGHIDIDNEAEEWMRDRLGDRAVTINSLFGVYELWQNERKRLIPSRLFNPMAEPEETPESIQDGLDNLSDEALASLRTRTIKLATRR